MLRLLILLSVLGLGATAVPVAAQAPDEPVTGIIRGIEQLNSSGQVGSIRLLPQGRSTIIEISMEGAPANRAEAITIHRGKNCQTVDPRAVLRLADLNHARSRSTAPMPMNRLLSGNYSLIIFSNNSPEARAVACGHLYL